MDEILILQNRLADICKDKGLSQTDLAKLVGYQETRFFLSKQVNINQQTNQHYRYELP